MKSYIEYNGKRYENLRDTLLAVPDSVESITVRLYDTDGCYEDIELERGTAGDIIYTAYEVLGESEEMYAEEINTAAEAKAIAEEIGGTAYITEQTLWERIESERI